MYNIDTEIEIHAPAALVWEVLTDFRAYPQWNPFVRSISGALEEGGQLEVFIQPAGSRGMRFRPRVLAALRERELRWRGSLLFRGLFDGEHHIRIEPLDSGGVRLRHGEHFAGLLVPLFRGQLEEGTLQGFHAMNAALKQRVEAGG